MKIASLVLRCRPDDRTDLEANVIRIPGVEVHGRGDDRLIVTVEDGEGYAMTDSLVAASTDPRVMSVTLAYEYTDEGLELEEA